MTDWPTYNVTMTGHAAAVLRAVPNAIIRFDFMGEGWACSVLPTESDLLPNGEHEAYGEGIDPLAALLDAQRILND